MNIKKAKYITGLIEELDDSYGFRFDDFSRELSNEFWRKSTRGFDDVLDISDKEYSKTITDFYYFGCLNQHLHADGSEHSGPGGYDQFFSEMFLMSDECQDDVYELDLLIMMAERWTKYIPRFATRLMDHVASVELTLDRQESINSNDPEYDELFKKFEKDFNGDLDEVLDIRSSKIVFQNPRYEQLKDIDKVYEKTRELINIFNDSDLGDILLASVKEELSKVEDRKEIQLNICGNVPETGNGEYLHYVEKKHPKTNLNNIIELVDELINGDKDTLVVYTCCDHVVNYIRYAVNQKDIFLENDILVYFDSKNNGTGHTITSSGKIDPILDDGFYDASLKYIFKLETNEL